MTSGGGADVKGIRIAWALAVVAGLALGAPTLADAHAIIESATPAVGAVVSGPDFDVTLRYNSRLDHRRSRLSLTGPDGGTRSLPIILPATDPASLSARATGLASGAYVLHWQVLAVDGHMTRGNIPFTVGGR